MDEIKRTLEAASIAWYGDCQPARAGVSPHNRSKLGVVGADSQYLGKDILDDGWSWRKTSDSSAFEMPPAPHDKEAIEYNEDLIEVSDGLMPPLQPLKILTVGGSHTNCFLRQVIAGTR